MSSSLSGFPRIASLNGLLVSTSAGVTGLAPLQAEAVECADGVTAEEKFTSLASGMGDHAAVLADTSTPGHVKLGMGIERLPDGTININGTANFEAAMAAHVANPAAHALITETVGSMKLWHPGVTPPADWALANGDLVSVSDYSALYGVIGQNYSPASTASGMFCLPTIPEAQFYGEWTNAGFTGPVTTLDIHPITGDVYAAGTGTGSRIVVLRGGTGSWESTGSIAADWYHIKINPRTEDVWACTTNGAVYVLRGGTGAWTDTGSGNAAWRWLDIHLDSGDVWACADGAAVHVLRGGTGAWTPMSGAGYYYGIACNQVTGDVFVTQSGGPVTVLRAGTGSWNSTASINATWRGITIQNSTGDVYAAASQGHIMVLRGGVGPWRTISPTGTWHALAVDNDSGDVWGGEYSVSNFAQVQILKRGASQWAGTNSGSSKWIHLRIHPFTRNIWAVSHDAGIWTYPVQRMPYIIKLQ